jgi:signal peptidase I
MEPTIHKEEKFVAEMTTLEPSRGDLVIFQHERVLLVKRVIGVEGDVVEGRNLQVFVNGKLQQEPYVQHIGIRPLDPRTLETFGPLTVPPGKLFVAGDNRDYSYDSRDPHHGLISHDDIRGKPIRIVWSPLRQRIGTPTK